MVVLAPDPEWMSFSSSNPWARRVGRIAWLGVLLVAPWGPSRPASATEPPSSQEAITPRIAVAVDPSGNNVCQYAQALLRVINIMIGVVFNSHYLL